MDIITSITTNNSNNTSTYTSSDRMDVITTITNDNSNSTRTNTSSSNSGDSGDNTSMILRLLEVGLLFEYLHTIMIIRLLTSSRLLKNFRGIINIITIIIIFNIIITILLS